MTPFDSDWEFQYDNELPFYLKGREFYSVEKETWHRLILGSSDLLLLIWEFDKNG